MERQHLQALLQLINVSSQRGAWRGEELADVGMLFRIVQQEIQANEQEVNETPMEFPSDAESV